MVMPVAAVMGMGMAVIRMRNSRCLLLAMLVLGESWASDTFADPLTLDEVLSSSRQHAPLILEADAAQRIAQANARAAYGAFDTVLEQDNYGRLSGFWDGKITDTRLSKRFQSFNTRVYTGYRISDGEFPIYEDVLFTNSLGEIKVGVALSLLRDRDFDQDRFRLLDTRLARNRADLDLQLTQVQVQFQAMSIYQEWLAQGLALRAYDELLALAITRQQAFEKRVERGDLARIFLNENQQNILKREVLVNETQRAFINAAQRLSFYYRDFAGRPVVPDLNQLPQDFAEKKVLVLHDLNGDVLEAVSDRPELRLVENEMDLAQAELRLGRNLLKPSLDVSLETARDFGSGSITREGTDVILAMNFSIPLERTQARGRISAAQARLDQLQYKQQRINEQLVIEVQNLANDIEAARRFVAITDQEVVQAEIMQQAERRRFENGASDFFLLNLREENTADAKIRNIQAQAEYFVALAAYYAATVQLDQLGL